MLIDSSLCLIPVKHERSFKALAKSPTNWKSLFVICLGPLSGHLSFLKVRPISLLKFYDLQPIGEKGF